jgi:hypothetical protein
MKSSVLQWLREVGFTRAFRGTGGASCACWEYMSLLSCGPLWTACTFAALRIQRCS